MSAEFRAELLALLPRLRRFALGISCDRDRADDLVQQACEKALARQHQWQAGTRLDSWMYRIVQNLWIDEKRGSSARAHLPLDEVDEMEADVKWEDAVQAEMSLDQVMQALAKLSEPMRAVLMLVCVEGLGYQAAAEVLEVPIGTVMSRLSRARLALHRCLNTPDTVLTGGDHARIH